MESDNESWLQQLQCATVPLIKHTVCQLLLQCGCNIVESLLKDLGKSISASYEWVNCEAASVTNHAASVFLKVHAC